MLLLYIELEVTIFILYIQMLF